MPALVAKIILLLLQLVPDAIHELKRQQGQRAVVAADKAVDDFVDAALASAPVAGCGRPGCPLRAGGLRNDTPSGDIQAAKDLPRTGTGGGTGGP
jgi:hypothetical protein